MSIPLPNPKRNGDARKTGYNLSPIAKAKKNLESPRPYSSKTNRKQSRKKPLISNDRIQLFLYADFTYLRKASHTMLLTIKYDSNTILSLSAHVPSWSLVQGLLETVAHQCHFSLISHAQQPIVALIYLKTSVLLGSRHGNRGKHIILTCITEQSRIACVSCILPS